MLTKADLTNPFLVSFFEDIQADRDANHRRAAELREQVRIVLHEQHEMTKPAPAADATVGTREYMDKGQLAEYSGWSPRWLEDRARDLIDPLPAVAGTGERSRLGKRMFSRSAYDRWFARRQARNPDTFVSGLVDEVFDEARGKRRKTP
jgi:hypothetical protein